MVEAATYTGAEQTPGVTVQDGETTLMADIDFQDVTYSGNINAGEASVSVTGKGNYSGTVNKNFTIGIAGNEILRATVRIALLPAIGLTWVVMHNYLALTILLMLSLIWLKGKQKVHLN